MKKILALILALVVVFSFVACGKDGDGSGNGIFGGGQSSSKGQGSGDLIGMWYVESTQHDSTDRNKSLMYDLLDRVYYFPGAQMEFRTDGTLSLNGMICDYSIPRANTIKTVNAQKEVTECTYELSGNKLTLNFYSDDYIVVFSKTPVEKQQEPTEEKNKTHVSQSIIGDEQIGAIKEVIPDIDMENRPEIDMDEMLEFDMENMPEFDMDDFSAIGKAIS